MNISIHDKNAFVNSFLTPIGKVTNSAVIKVEKNSFSSLIATSDNSIILSAIYSNQNNADEFSLNIPDISKLIRILSVIDATAIELNLDKNNISYSSKNIRFKYHLFEDGIIVSPRLNVDKLLSLEFNGKCSSPYSFCLPHFMQMRSERCLVGIIITWCRWPLL
jgi:hypothetical protein